MILNVVYGVKFFGFQLRNKQLNNFISNYRRERATGSTYFLWLMLKIENVLT